MSEINQREFLDFAQTKETVWVSMSNWYYDNRMTKTYSFNSTEEIKIRIQDCLPDFKVVTEMKTPMRSTSAIVKHIIQSWGQAQDFTDGLMGDKSHQKKQGKVFQEVLMLESDPPPNLMEGLEPILIETDATASMDYFLKLALDKVLPSCSSRGLIIVINDGLMYQEHVKHFSKQLTCDCKFLGQVLSLDQALEKNNQAQPLFQTTLYQSPESDIVQWINGTNRQKPLVVSHELIKGFEAETIIDMNNQVAVSSRASVTFIAGLKHFFKQFMFAQHVINQLIANPNHDCGKIVSRSERQIAFKLDPMSEIDTFLQQNGFQRSPSLPDAQNYDNGNPVFNCLADQLKITHQKLKQDLQEHSRSRQGFQKLASNLKASPSFHHNLPALISIEENLMELIAISQDVKIKVLSQTCTKWINKQGSKEVYLYSFAPLLGLFSITK